MGALHSGRLGSVGHISFDLDLILKAMRLARISPSESLRTPEIDSTKADKGTLSAKSSSKLRSCGLDSYPGMACCRFPLPVFTLTALAVHVVGLVIQLTLC